MGTVVDVDGNSYSTVVIGTQEWTTTNLITTKLNDGTLIPEVTLAASWAALSTLGRCTYNNDEATYKTTYGFLYNWYAVDSGKLAPTGWHVPTNTEWNTLVTYLGGESVAGGKLKEVGTTHWLTPNTGATNEVGFTALPGGIRTYTGVYDSITSSGGWWTTTEHSNPVFSLDWSIDYGNDDIYPSQYRKATGWSVRCIKNDPVYDFSGTPLSGVDPLKVNFTDLSVA